MRLVLLLLARDEADVVDAQISYHLHAGVDFVIATDHRSVDGTTEILERYAAAGVLRLLREEGEAFPDPEWRTRMARLAAVEHDADWVILADADEFWWPCGGDLKEVLDAVPSRFGVVRGVWRQFVPRPFDERLFAERMTVRTFSATDPNRPFRPQVKVAARAHASLDVAYGGHDARGPGAVPLRGWYPFEVLHFPVRSPQQCERKYATAWAVRERDPGRGQRPYVAVARAAGSGGAYYDSLVLGDDEVDARVADGTVEIDVRLRDALRALPRVAEGRFATPDGPSPLLRASRRSLALDASVARDAELVEERDAARRLHVGVEAVAARVSRLERHRVGGLLVRR